MKKIIRAMDLYIRVGNIENIRYKALFYMFKAQYAVLKYTDIYDKAINFLEKAIEIIGENPGKELKHLLSNLYTNLGDYKLTQRNRKEVFDCYNKAYNLLVEIGELYIYDGYMLARKTAEFYAISGDFQKAIEVLERFTEYFKPPYIPRNYAEYIEFCQKEEYTSLLEYAELLEFIGALKAKIEQNIDFERKQL